MDGRKQTHHVSAYVWRERNDDRRLGIAVSRNGTHTHEQRQRGMQATIAPTGQFFTQLGLLVLQLLDVLALTPVPEVVVDVPLHSLLIGQLVIKRLDPFDKDTLPARPQPNGAGGWQ